MWSKIIKWMESFRGKKKLTVEELYEDLRSYSKNKLVKELIVQAQINNGNQCGVESDYKKQVKGFSKKKLIKAIILLRLYNNKQIKRELTKNAMDIIKKKG